MDQPANLRVLGIHSSPFQRGNVASLLDYALAQAAAVAGVTTEAVALTGLAMRGCRHCNWCLEKQTPGKWCDIEDDASPILDKIKACDVLLLASPVYFGRLSSQLAALIERTRCFIFGKVQPMALRGKIGLALAVAWAAHGGVETTLQSIDSAFLIHEMPIPSVHASGAFWGVGAVAGRRRPPAEDPGGEATVLHNKRTLLSASLMVQKAITMARIGRGQIG